MSRRAARAHAFALIFQFPFHQDLDLEEAAGLYLSGVTDVTDGERAFIEDECRQTAKRLDEIDRKIAAFSEGWQVDRLGKTDLAILRLAVYEMDYAPDIPVNVSISEAVVLAKIYGTDDSPAFINGILGKMAEQNGANSVHGDSHV